MKRLGTVIIVAALLAAPAAIASGKHLKLTAVVTGQTKKDITTSTGKGVSTVTLYSVREGKKTVGTMVVYTAAVGCAGNTCLEDGTTNLKVGKVRGKAKLHVIVRFSGCPPCVPPTPVKFQSSTGTISNAKHGSEKISVTGKFPKTKGSKVTFALSY